MGRLRATVDEIRIWFTGGELWPSVTAARSDVEALEYKRGAIGGSVWVVLKDGRRLPTRFLPVNVSGVLQGLCQLGWPTRKAE
jgi:hypothetical protein